MTDKEVMQMALDALVEADQRDGYRSYKEEIEALRAALAQGEPEPVAWMYFNKDGECEQIEYGAPYNDPSVTPLYTAPPQRPWQGLTDEEITAIWNAKDIDENTTVSGINRAIEAKLKEKNGY